MDTSTNTAVHVTPTAAPAASVAPAAAPAPAPAARPRVTIWTDGSSRGNPGPGGFCAVLYFTDASGELHTRELHDGYRLTTNNRMEMLAVIRALETLKCACVVDIHSDSSYVVNAHNQHWIEGWQRKGWKSATKKPVKNIDLWKRLIEASQKHAISYHWVKGHAGIAGNERCDELATMAADAPRETQLIDEVFEQEYIAHTGALPFDV